MGHGEVSAFQHTAWSAIYYHVIAWPFGLAPNVTDPDIQDRLVLQWTLDHVDSYLGMWGILLSGWLS